MFKPTAGQKTRIAVSITVSRTRHLSCVNTSKTESNTVTKCITLTLLTKTK